MLYGDRNDMRRMFADAWRGRRAGRVLPALESSLADVVELHPEYHELLEQGDLGRDYRVEAGETNPFLHMALHVAVREQLSVDRPPGIRDAWQHLCERLGDTHAAEHRLLDCLAETLHLAQRRGQPPDEQAYLEAVRRL